MRNDNFSTIAKFKVIDNVSADPSSCRASSPSPTFRPSSTRCIYKCGFSDLLDDWIFTIALFYRMSVAITIRDVAVQLATHRDTGRESPRPFTRHLYLYLDAHISTVHSLRTRGLCSKYAVSFNITPHSEDCIFFVCTVYMLHKSLSARANYLFTLATCDSYLDHDSRSAYTSLCPLGRAEVIADLLRGP